MMNLDRQIEVCRQASGVRIDWKQVLPGDIFFAIRQYKPSSGIRRIIWEGMRILQFRSPKMLDALVRAAGWTPWADDLKRLAAAQLDGNAFASKALESGADYAFVDSPAAAGDARCILVENTETRLYEIARHIRSERKMPVIAVTGSVGKTTTKDLIAAVLSKKYRLAKSSGSYNSAAYISSLLLSLDSRDEMMVLEFGGLALHTIRGLCEIAGPTHGVITRVGLAHLNTFGSEENIRRGKWELPDYLQARGGHFFQNLDDPWIGKQPVDGIRVTTFGGTGEVRGATLSADPFLKVRWQRDGAAGPVDIQTRLYGRYNLENVLAAIAVGRHFGVTDEAIVAAIEACPPSENRSQLVRKDSNIFILDSGSINPTSLRAALENFGQASGSRKMVVLADMLRMGPRTDAEHRRAIKQVRALRLEMAVFVGENFWRVRDDSAGLFFRSTPALRRWWEGQKIENMHILVKGAIRFRLVDVLGVEPEGHN